MVYMEAYLTGAMQARAMSTHQQLFMCGSCHALHAQRPVRQSKSHFTPPAVICMLCTAVSRVQSVQHVVCTVVGRMQSEQ